MAAPRKAPAKSEEPVPISRGARRRPTPVKSSQQIPELERLEVKPIELAERQKLNLWQKRAAILDEVGIVPKRGWNDFHKYWFTLEADLVAYLGPLFSKYAIVVEVSVDFDKVQRITMGEKNVLTRLPMRISLVNADKPDERIDVDWVGEGSDTGDKGVYKAYTGGMKFFYMKFFMIATGDDPEGFARADEVAAVGAGAAVQIERVTDVPMGKGGYQEHPSEPQVLSLKAMSNALRLDAMQVLEFIDQTLGTKLLDQLPRDVLDEAEINRNATRVIRTAMSGEQVGQVIEAMTAKVAEADKVDDAPG